MKEHLDQITHGFRQLGLAALLTTGLASQAQTYLWQGHADVGIVYETDAWNLHVCQHEADPPLEYRPNTAVFGVDSIAAFNTVPTGSQFSFLGSPGSPVWILPQVQDPSLLFLGLGTEELPSGLFLDDHITLSLRAVRAPGQFSVYTVNPFGNPTVIMNSADGCTGVDSVLLAVGGHEHVNWAFSAPGTYEVDFEASGTLSDGSVFTSSGPTTYTFSVSAVPEPSSVALAMLGGALLLWRRRNRI